MASPNDTLSSTTEDPSILLRERARHYMPASDEDIAAMLKAIGVSSLEELFDHIDASVKFDGRINVPAELDYDDAKAHLRTMSEKNRATQSYIGDGLQDFSTPEIVGRVAGLRNLATAYTPYQPELSQGTLICHWIYQCQMAKLTGFEAVNASLYDRATAAFEAICAAVRLSKKDTVIIPKALFPGDHEVIDTLIADTEMKVVTLDLDAETGRISTAAMSKAIADAGKDLAAILFPQVNALGLLEDVDALTDLATEAKAISIAVIDPILLAKGGLKAPADYGGDAQGVDIIVGEAQHLALDPNFGGPGLGLFGVRYGAKNNKYVRSAPGRFVGKAEDLAGRECRVAVLSTREQHIRKEKATSNICSNQAFLSTLVGAALLVRGDDGLGDAIATARQRAEAFAGAVGGIAGIALAYPDMPFFNEVVLAIDEQPTKLLEKLREQGFTAGVDVSDRIAGDRHLLKVSFSDRDDQNPEALLAALRDILGSAGSEAADAPDIPQVFRRIEAPCLATFPADTVFEYYEKLGRLNVSPDQACYPLGSCTMKYNPILNEWAANLPGFTRIHPQAPLDDVQGCLELLHEIQEWFTGITGLPGVTTQPVAGAQGELVGIKMMQAYHRDHSETTRDVILIPRSAHGTNFATATMAGFVGNGKNGKGGIVYLEADADGLIDMADLRQTIDEFGTRIAGVMITNPNTTGIFETSFKEVADLIHDIGGLVYMDGANMNAIAGWVNLGAIGVDAVHNNLHKTWTIPHGGGGPGDAIVAVSERLVDCLPGYQIEKQGERFVPVRPAKSIGSFHRHWGNFAHKIRCYAYLLRLGKEGIRKMSAVATLSARYLFEKLRTVYAELPAEAQATPRMHEFILTLTDEEFDMIDAAGVSKSCIITRIGKLFLDFGYHAPTVAWPEAFGLMIEPTESYTMAELDRFAEVVAAIKHLVIDEPTVLHSAPHFTPIDRVDEVSANRAPILSDSLETLPKVHESRISQHELLTMSTQEIAERIKAASKRALDAELAGACSK